MIGNDRPTVKKRSGGLTHLGRKLHRYVSIDGGAGAHLLAQLAGRDPYFQQVSSPRHADLLLIVTPISQKLAPAVVAMAKALVRPAHVLLIDATHGISTAFPRETFVSVEDLFPGAARVPGNSIETLLAMALRPEQWSELSVASQFEPDATTIPLPQRQELELATELAVLSLGPLQPFTAGPLRLFLICDGEQVLSLQVEAGYAYRGIEQAMMGVNWPEALALSSQCDPLAPIAGQLAYVRALEQLQGWQPSVSITALREAAMALERAQNVLWWLVRFARIIDDAPLFERSYHLATDLALLASSVWETSPLTWIQPQQVVRRSVIGTIDTTKWRRIAERIDRLTRHLTHHRGLALRTQEIGVLAPDRLEAAGILNGPIFQASDTGKGDVLSRLLARLHIATRDVFEIMDTLLKRETAREQMPDWNVPEGEVRFTVNGPRGAIGLHLLSQGGTGPALVEWQRPSATLLALLPELLTGQKLADAEVILASLDLAMAEGDG